MYVGFLNQLQTQFKTLQNNLYAASSVNKLFIIDGISGDNNKIALCYNKTSLLLQNINASINATYEEINRIKNEMQKIKESLL